MKTTNLYYKTLSNLGYSSTSLNYNILKQVYENYYDDETKTINTPPLQSILLFIDRIEKRKGFATSKEVYGELLIYFEYVNIFLKKLGSQIDRFSMEDQIGIMYAYLKTFKQRIDDGRIKIINILDYQFPLTIEKK